MILVFALLCKLKIGNRQPTTNIYFLCGKHLFFAEKIGIIARLYLSFSFITVLQKIIALSQQLQH
jgi:hypothetical protein